MCMLYLGPLKKVILPGLQALLGIGSKCLYGLLGPKALIPSPIYLSIYVSIYLHLYLIYFCIYIYIYIYSASLSISPSIFIPMSISPSISISIPISISISISTYIYLSLFVYQSTNLSIYLSPLSPATDTGARRGVCLRDCHGP